MMSELKFWVNYASTCMASVYPSHQFRENEVPKTASRQQASLRRQRWNSLKSDFSRPELSSGPNVRWKQGGGCGPNPADPADWVITPSSGNMFAFPTCRLDYNHFWLFSWKDFVFFFSTISSSFWLTHFELWMGKKMTIPNKHVLFYFIFFKDHLAAKSRLCTFSSRVSQFP